MLDVGQMTYDRRRAHWQPILCLAVACGLLLDPCRAIALTGDIRNDPAEIVKKYARLDFKGARLESRSQEVLEPFIDWTEEPIWGTVVVVESYEVLEHTKHWEIVSPMEAVIPVDYRVVGTMYWKTATFLAEARRTRVRFRVKGKLHRWRLMGPHIPPHVGLKRMVKFLRQAILEERDPSRRQRLTALQKELEKAGEDAR